MAIFDIEKDELLRLSDKEIVEAWLQPEGLLGKIIDLDDVSTRILNYIAPVAP